MRGDMKMYNKTVKNKKMDEVSLVAFKYGNSPLSANNAFWGADSETEIDIAWLFFLISYKDRRILVDVGNGDINVFIQYGFKMRNFRAPVSLLEEYGLFPDDITDIFVTHADFDHIGDLALYKKANIYIQKNELENGHGLIGYNRRIITFDTSLTVLEKFQLQCIGGHTNGSSIILFQHGELMYVLGGDACYVNASLEQQIPTGRTCDIAKSREFIQKFQNPGFRVLLSHEPSIVKENSVFSVLLPDPFG